MDLLDFFRGVHSWRKLYRLIGRLPAEGHYKSALVMDEETAARLARAEAEGLIESPPDADTVEMSPLRYGPIEQRLDVIADLLQYLYAATVRSTEKVKPMPRPTTALAKAREAVQLEQLNAIANMMVAPEE